MPLQGCTPAGHEYALMGLTTFDGVRGIWEGGWGGEPAVRSASNF